MSSRDGRGQGAPHRVRERLGAWHVWLLFAATASLAYPLTSDLIPFDALYLLIGLGAVTACFAGIRRNRPVPSAAWWVLAVGLTLTVSGDLLYIGEWEITGHEPPFPGVPDLLYLPGIVSVAVAGGLLAWQRHRTATARSLIDAALVAVAAAALLWLVVGTETLRGDEATLSVIVLGFAYPLMDAALLGVLAALVIGGERTSGAIRLLIAAFTVQFVADTVYLLEAADGVYASGSLLDVGWLLSYVFIAAAALHPSMAEGAAPLPPKLVDLSARHVFGIATPVVLAGAALLVVAHTSARDDPERFVTDLTVLVPAGVIITVLLVLRVVSVSNELARTARQRDRGVHRELVVADIASMLARATSLSEIHTILERATGLLPGRDGKVELFEDPADRPRTPAWRRTLADDGTALIATTDRPLDDDHERALDRLSSDVAMAIDRCRLADELRSSERRFRSLVRHAPDAITVHSPNGAITYVTPAMGEIVGVPEESLRGRRWTDLIHPDDLRDALDVHRSLLAATTGADGSQTSLLELRLRHADGSWRWVETRLTNLIDDPSVNGIVANHRDVTERRGLQRELEHQATHDPLTGVANRRRFGDEIGVLGSSQTDAIVFLDLDHFKEINDRLGHAAGDRVLGEVARRLVDAVRPEDLVARLGGDEFAVLLRHTTPAEAAHAADRLLEALREPLAIGDEHVVVQASAGLAIASEGAPPTDLLQDADLAMYRAKAAGRGRVERATPRPNEPTADTVPS